MQKYHLLGSPTEQFLANKLALLTTIAPLGLLLHFLNCNPKWEVSYIYIHCIYIYILYITYIYIYCIYIYVYIYICIYIYIPIYLKSLGPCFVTVPVLQACSTIYLEIVLHKSRGKTRCFPIVGFPASHVACLLVPCNVEPPNYKFVISWSINPMNYSYSSKYPKHS